MVKLSHIYFIMSVLLVSGFSFATTHYVSTNGTNDVASGYTTWAGAATQIQWAVSMATAGDTVLVTNGVYTTGTPIQDTYQTASYNIVYMTNANVVLQSVNGPLVTIIDGNSIYTVVCAPIASTVSGFTIRNGNAGSGGGVRILQAAYIPGPVIITNCLIYNNSAGYGGGVYAYNCGSAVFANCTIYSNTASGGGGGTQGWVFDSYFDNCVFYGNKSTEPSYGAGNNGGGLQIYATQCRIRNSLFYRNNSYSSGGGISVRGDGAGWATTIENCTIVNNTSSNMGAGIQFFDSVLNNNNTMRNLIVYNNNSAVSIYADVYVTNTVFTNCCIGNTNGVFNWNTSGNITNAPALAGTNVDNYRLSAYSPCINTGTNQGWMTGAVDLDGNRRLDRLSGLVDMGAYEFIYKFTLFKVR